MSQPLYDPSTNDMLADGNPPTAFTMNEWNRLREDLFAKGGVLMPNGKVAGHHQNSNSPEHRAWCMAKHMNGMQEDYGRSFLVVGLKGRLIAEEALTILGVPCTPAPPPGTAGPPACTTPDQRIRAYQFGTAVHVDAAYAGCVNKVKNDLHVLRVNSNKGSHVNSGPFLPRDKPVVANATYCVALHVFNNTAWVGGGVQPYVPRPAPAAPVPAPVARKLPAPVPAPVPAPMPLVAAPRGVPAPVPPALGSWIPKQVDRTKVKSVNELRAICEESKFCREKPPFLMGLSFIPAGPARIPSARQRFMEHLMNKPLVRSENAWLPAPVRAPVRASPRAAPCAAPRASARRRPRTARPRGRQARG